MKRYLIFVTLFPLGMNALIFAFLTPTRNFGYNFAAIYVLELVPAFLMGLTDEIVERKKRFVRASFGALAGFVLTPIPIWLIDSYKSYWQWPPAWQFALVGGMGALVAFSCALVVQFVSAGRNRA